MKDGRARTAWLLLPRQLRELPADLAGTLLFVFAVNVAVFAPLLNATPLRIVLGLPFVLFVPGYAVVAALFPERGSTVDTPAGDAELDATETASTETNREGIDGIERVALAFGLSIAVVPLTGLVLNFTPWGIRLVPVMVATSLVTLGATWVGARRRNALPESERFSVPYRRWLAAAHSELFEPDTRTDTALNVLVVVSVLLAVTSVGYAVTVPKEGEAFTEFYLLTEQDNELLADDYPTDMTVGNASELVVGVSNHEHTDVEYTIVAQLQAVTVVPNETGIENRTVSNETGDTRTEIRVDQRVELDRFQTALADNETWLRPHTITPTISGERLRLQYLLYRGAPPETPSADTAYRKLHLWVNVTR